MPRSSNCPSLCRSYACAVSSSDGSIDLSHLEALPGPSCVSTVPQLKRERSLRARFAEANGNYHSISNTWLVRGFPSSSPLTPATQSGLFGAFIPFTDHRQSCFGES